MFALRMFLSVIEDLVLVVSKTTSKVWASAFMEGNDLQF
jgi:hypothetical protein